MQPLHILVTNDDGVNAPGLLALAAEMKKLGQVTILAPDHNWSASGHVKTLHRPLRVKEFLLADGTHALACDGAPSDCVALAFLGLLPETPQLVLSGINPHENVGHDVTYSGTVTAAMEAAISGVPGIAVSLNSPENHLGDLDYAPAAEYAGKITRLVIDHGLPKNTVLNVNVPYLPADSIQGIRLTRQGLRVYRDQLIPRQDPRGRPYYWIGGEAPTGVPQDGTDIGALGEGYISVTPLHLDLTSYRALDELQAWSWE